jgi:hypothetical protein
MFFRNFYIYLQVHTALQASKRTSGSHITWPGIRRFMDDYVVTKVLHKHLPTTAISELHGKIKKNRE